MAECRGRILVVDDDEGMRELLVRYLSDNGYAATAVADGTSMKRHLATHLVDLILLDVMLPGEDGLSLARALSTQGAPAIIMLSARGEEIDRIVGLEVGADDYLPKPFSHRELLARVTAVLRRRQPAVGAFSGWSVVCTHECVRYVQRTQLEQFHQAVVHVATTPDSTRVSISSAPIPRRAAKTSAVCSPRAGALRAGLCAPSTDIGRPGAGWVPIRGWSSSVKSGLALTRGLRATSAKVW